MAQAPGRPEVEWGAMLLQSSSFFSAEVPAASSSERKKLAEALEQRDAILLRQRIAEWKGKDLDTKLKEARQLS